MADEDDLQSSDDNEPETEDDEILSEKTQEAVDNGIIDETEVDDFEGLNDELKDMVLDGQISFNDAKVVNF